MGWNSEIDYVPGKRDKPLIAIIGDSTTQALDVDVEDSIASRLRQLVDGRYDVYSFAKGGGALSQYLHVSRYVNENFDPDILVFNVEANNFYQSLCNIMNPVGMMCLRDDSPEIREANIIPYVPSRNRRWARNSSLIRYVVLNIGLSSLTRRPDAPTLSPTPDRESDVQLRERVERSTDYLLARIALENPDKTVVFMMDVRKRLYNGNLAQQDDFRSRTRDLLIQKSDEYRFSFIDLTDPFLTAYQEDGQKFESLDGFHWNKRGHSVAAEALFESLQEIGAIQ